MTNYLTSARILLGGVEVTKLIPILILLAACIPDVPTLDEVAVPLDLDSPCPVIPVMVDASSKDGLYSFDLVYNLCYPGRVFLCSEGPFWSWRCSEGVFNAPELEAIVRLLAMERSAPVRDAVCDEPEPEPEPEWLGSHRPTETIDD